LKILSYNVNGIRAALKKNFASWLQEVTPDVVCLQETKAIASQVDTTIFEDLGYHHYWHSAQRKGYSGVAILTKEKVVNVTKGTGIKHIDFEGRVIRADFEKVSIISLYLPSGTNLNRLDYKFKFMDEFQSYIDDLKKDYPNLVVSGD
jgi:exodeoxyribonuclease-3